MAGEDIRADNWRAMGNIKVGSDILWKGSGATFRILSFILGLFDPKWRKRTWKPWHVGYVVKVLDSGEIVTSQAVARGIEAITYSSVEEMGDCRIYNWLDNPDGERIETYVADHLGDPYDPWAYPWTILAFIIEKIFHWSFRIVNRAYTCWENMCQKDRYMGKELQPEEEFPLINKIIDKLEGG